MRYYYENTGGASSFSSKIYVRSTGIGTCHYPLHWHEDIELDYILSGAVNAVVGGKRVRVEQGDFLFINSGELHETDADSEQEMRSVTLMLSYRMLKEYCPEIDSCSFDFGGRQTAKQEICALLGECGEVQRAKKDFYRLEQDILVRRIAGILLKDCLVHNHLKVGTAELAPIRRAMAYIEENYRREIPLEEISAAVGMSPTYFSRQFRRITGQTFRDYLTGIRLFNAYGLLCGSNLLVSEVADKCGFANVKSFIEAFRRSYGTTPDRYRRTGGGEIR